MAYLSRGILVLGNKPMFEDVDCDDLGATIKATILEVFGFYPVLQVHENWTMTHDFMGDELENGPSELRDYRVILDTERLDLVPGWELNYVDGLLEKVIARRMSDDQALETFAYASKKYCFSDTEDWWSAMELKEIPEDRVVFKLEVELG